MESAYKFNLEHAIQNWKQSWTQSAQLKPEDVEELCSHLFDEIDALKANGLNDEEAFFVAQKRIGSIEKLPNEYEKVDRMYSLSKKLKPILLGALAYLVVMELINLVIHSFFVLEVFTGWRSPNVLSVISGCGLFFLILFWAYKSTKPMYSRVVNFFTLSVAFIVLKAIYMSSYVGISVKMSSTMAPTLGYYKMQEVTCYMFIVAFLLLTSLFIYFRDKKLKLAFQ